MLCSECNKIIRPVVAIDIDGTMGDFHLHFLKFATGYMYGQQSFSPPVAAYDGSQSMKLWFCNYFNVGEDVWRDIKLSYRQGGMKRTMPSFGWGRRVTEACHRAGAEVWVTTTRPYLRLDNVDPDTRFWLEQHLVTYDGLIYDEDKYSHLLRYVGAGRVVAVVDDLPEEFNKAARLFGNGVPILYRGYHNRYFWDALSDRRQIAHSGEVVWSLIHSRLINWKGLSDVT